MNVLFIYPNITGQLHSPLGITSLSAVLKSAGHETMLFDTTWGYDKEGLFRAIKEFKPKLICFSVRNNDYFFALGIAKEIKRSHAIPIIFGGPQATLNPKRLIAEDCIDFVCIGEGEYALKELAEKLEKKKSTCNIKNVWAKKNGKVFQNQVRSLIQNLDELPFPDWQMLDKRHLEGKSTFFLIGSRGCPYQCTYCANHAFQKIYQDKGNYVRYKSPKKVIEEIKEAKKSIKISWVNFDDDTFTLNKKWLKEVCELYKKEINLPFSINGRANTIDLEILQILKDSGCWSISIGLEEGNEKIRNEVLKRNMKTETIIKAFNDAKRLGIKTYAFNMVGLPFETEKTIFETIELNRQCRPDAIQVSIFSPYEGTELHEMCAK
ncbi:MAG: radical SAM protein, partial [Candidatus Diapherotrites archaeon]|nr:radical SAM protein [Candidatus Diapherotrites archaeon]